MTDQRDARIRELEAALRKIVDAIPADQPKEWLHHHWYLAVARRALAPALPDSEPAEGDDKYWAAQVYQAVGVLLSDAGRFEDDDGQALLDVCSYLAGQRDKEPKDILPFDSKDYTPPQRRDALEAFENLLERWIEDSTKGQNDKFFGIPVEWKSEVETVRRALSAGVPEVDDPLEGSDDLKEAYRAACVRLRELGETSVPLFRPYRVPKAVWGLPEEFDERSRCAIDLASTLWRIAADRVREALAQSEQGQVPDAEDLAKAFHATYETLAPQYGYETRDETREFDPGSANGKLMIAVCRVIRERMRLGVAAAPEPGPENGD